MYAQIYGLRVMAVLAVEVAALEENNSSIPWTINEA
jgi:hypothetical protein